MIRQTNQKQLTWQDMIRPNDLSLCINMDFPCSKPW